MGLAVPDQSWKDSGRQTAFLPALAGMHSPSLSYQGRAFAISGLVGLA